MKEHGEFISSSDWHLHLKVSWICVHVIGAYVLTQLKASNLEFMESHPQIEFQLSKLSREAAETSAVKPQSIQ